MTRPRKYTARKKRPSISVRAETYERLKALELPVTVTLETIIREYLDAQEKTS